ncbi:conserved hypothetical protein [Novosphingobium sp. CF614]|uniref:TorF family putative porin n=1 Tax=Novosphingobium sp. CF614 TaxID=1884364 RepID=UPI0008F44E20|nr:TorF family putative porin [Novosphingobium sp. CF614]SFF98694.1 conserved hypothetical protein [Novosphingobium sp. CF614]
MKTLIMAAAAACALLPAAAMADDAGGSGIDISASLTGATDYVWRGVSQTDNHAAVFAAVNVGYKGFYAGAGTENVDFLGINQEYDLWAGYALDLGAVKIDAGMVRYGYVDAPVDIDTLEGKLALTVPVGKGSLTAAGYYTGNYFGSSNSALYTVLSGSYPLTDKLGINGAVGHQQISDASSDYTTWNAGLSYKVLPGATATVGYYDTDRSKNRLSRARVMGSFTIGF